MLDIKYIRTHHDKLQEAVKNKNIDLDISNLLALDKQRVDLLQKIEKLQSEKNDINFQMKQANSDIVRQEIILKARDIKQKVDILEKEYVIVQRLFREHMVLVPVIPSADTPIGKNEDENVEVARWGDIPEFDFPVKDHITLGKDLDILDLERGVKTSGYRGYYLKNEGALLVMAIMQYALFKMVEKGYKPMIPPTLIKEFALYGSGYFKGDTYNSEIDEIYQISTRGKQIDGSLDKEQKFLVGTAEPSLLAYYSGEVLDESQLPLRLCGYSQCYRSEIGSYGKDTRGMYRVHEFMKIEQVIVAPADDEIVTKLQDEMIDISHEMHRELGLPHRKIQICTGDLSAGKYRMFDLEAWLPGLKRWGETGSSSNFLDWQSRRLDIKYKNKNGKKQFVYLLNNTALPSPRIFIAILENFQQADGSVRIPNILHRFMPAGITEIRR